jgi:hypothetical protein
MDGRADTRRCALQIKSNLPTRPPVQGATSLPPFTVAVSRPRPSTMEGSYTSSNPLQHPSPTLRALRRHTHLQPLQPRRPYSTTAPAPPLARFPSTHPIQPPPPPLSSRLHRPAARQSDRPRCVRARSASYVRMCVCTCVCMCTVRPGRRPTDGRKRAPRRRPPPARDLPHRRRPHCCCPPGAAWAEPPSTPPALARGHRPGRARRRPWRAHRQPPWPRQWRGRGRW